MGAVGEIGLGLTRTGAAGAFGSTLLGSFFLAEGGLWGADFC